MNAKQFLKLLSGYLRNTLSGSDRSLMQQWYDSFGTEERGVPGLENKETEERLRQELHSRIYSAIRQPGKPVEKKFVAYRRIAAAMLVFSIAGTAFWMLGKLHDRLYPREQTVHEIYREISTGTRQVKRLQLPDSSIIHLNANSKIRIPRVFASSGRQVYLDEGEAFFEVTKDPGRPFLVCASALSIHVLGTSFNVRAYSSLDQISVTVATGRVQVTDSLHVFAELKANQQVTYHKISASATVATAKPGNGQGWKTGIIQLEKAGFNELALAVYNLYGVHLQSLDPRTSAFSYNLTIRSDRSLEETMDLICTIHNTTFRRKGNDIIIYP